MIYGYARVSTEEQNLDGQILELEKLGCETIVVEKVSGKNLKRPELQTLISSLQKNDVLIVVKIDRLARSLIDLIFLLDEIASREAVLKIGATSYDFSTAEGRFYAGLFGLVAEYERALISERTKRGLASARAMGRVGGKPRGLSEEAKKIARKAYANRLKGLTVEENLKLTGIKSKDTLFKYIRFEVARLSEETGRGVAENGLDLLEK